MVSQAQNFTTLVDTNSDGKIDRFMEHRSKKPAPINSPSPFKNITWKSNPIGKGIFTGQAWCGLKSQNQWYRYSQTGDTHLLVQIHSGKNFATDAILSRSDGTWIVAQSNRYEPKRSRTKFEVYQVSWNPDASPFEVTHVQANTNSFELSFSHPLLPDTAKMDWAYRIQKANAESPLAIKQITVLDEAFQKVELVLAEPVQPDIEYAIAVDGVWSASRSPVANPNLRVIYSPTTAKPAN